MNRSGITFARRAAAVVLVAAATLAAGSGHAGVLPIITNVRTSVEGDSLAILYDVLDPDGDEMTILLRIAGSDAGIDADAASVRGDIGGGIASGESRRIILGRSALPEGELEDFIPRLLAYDGQGLGGEMIYIESRSGPPFFVDRYELTNEQFAAFVRSDGYELREHWIITDGSIEIVETGWNYCGRFRWQAPRYWDLNARPPWSADPNSPLASSPVLGVSWFEAYAYCGWAGRRLPSSTEWRKAAGFLDQAFPWGESVVGDAEPPDYDLANVKFGFGGYRHGSFGADGLERAGPVGSYSPRGDSPVGVADAIGNVWEWCADVVAVVDYGTFSCATRPIRGGSWATAVVKLNGPTKDLCPLYRTDTTGFRCFR